MHRSSFMKMQYFKDTYLNPSQDLKILDIGSFDKTGDYNYGLILNEKKWTYHGLDLRAGNNIDIVVENPYHWDEIEDETYDLVVSGQAFEHIEFFWLTLEEVKRILKPGGLFFLIVPSTGPVHKNPYDCYRFNEDAMKAMAKYINFNVIECGTNFDEVSDPWYDTFLVSRKPEGGSVEDLENKMDNLEAKLDLIMKKLNL
ncbi:MAG: class I SAM-dependent methyltransferase [Methanobrevibacter sp.]|uniref:class I SAM-dependent methyltransferase n=1 Tax=Methanobrevibacter sp. TaxID=66852 RepID=UPI0025D37FE3|nr:methyltransferase domain-containing protein [Methanobrevibacter sp.]MBE6497278.1 class I SAM-dependent methyltransferase [Methanobrevibacter sp.]